MNIIITVLMLIGAYLMGSIPIGYILVEKRKGVDIRTVGSGATGATNVASLCGWRWGIITIIGDFLKGFIPTFLAVRFWGLHWIIGLVGLLAVTGHIFPLFIPKPRFKGGKGVATTVGVLIPILTVALINYPYPWAFGGLGAIIVSWIAIILIFRRMGLASIFLMASIVLFFGVLEVLTYPTYLAILIFLTAALVHWAHRENWGRLLRGEERIMESKWEKE